MCRLRRFSSGKKWLVWLTMGAFVLSGMSIGEGMELSYCQGGELVTLEDTLCSGGLNFGQRKPDCLCINGVYRMWMDNCVVYDGFMENGCISLVNQDDLRIEGIRLAGNVRIPSLSSTTAAVYAEKTSEDYQTWRSYVVGENGSSRADNFYAVNGQPFVFVNELENDPKVGALGVKNKKWICVERQLKQEDKVCRYYRKVDDAGLWSPSDGTVYITVANKCTAPMGFKRVPLRPESCYNVSGPEDSECSLSCSEGSRPPFPPKPELESEGLFAEDPEGGLENELSRSVREFIDLSKPGDTILAPTEPSFLTKSLKGKDASASTKPSVRGKGSLQSGAASNPIGGGNKERIFINIEGGGGGNNKSGNPGERVFINIDEDENGIDTSTSKGGVVNPHKEESIFDPPMFFTDIDQSNFTKLTITEQLMANNFYLNRKLNHYSKLRQIGYLKPNDLRQISPTRTFELLDIIRDIGKKSCPNSYVSNIFIDQAVDLFVILHKGRNYRYTEDLLEDDFDWIKRILTECLAETEEIKMVFEKDEYSEQCDDLQRVKGVCYKDAVDNCSDLSISASHSRLGKHHMVVEAAWDLIDLTHIVCFPSFTESYRMFHQWEQASEKLFTREIKKLWHNPNLSMQVYQNLLTPSAKIDMYNLEMCVEGAYRVNPVLTRLSRPPEPRKFFRRKKRDLKRYMEYDESIEENNADGGEKGGGPAETEELDVYCRKTEPDFEYPC